MEGTEEKHSPPPRHKSSRGEMLKEKTRFRQALLGNADSARG